MDQDHRISSRHRALKEAKVVLHNSSTFNCILRNVSESGARLDFSDPANLPEQFELLLIGHNTLRPVQRMWARGASVGVKFTGPERPVPPNKF